MMERGSGCWRMCLTALATLAELAQLTWQHLHGGVVSHHLLDRAELPAVSNGWGALLVPALVWLLLGRVRRRYRQCPPARTRRFVGAVAAGFAGALLLGVGIAVSFTQGRGDLATGLFEALFVLALLLPVFRAECVLGLVLGMAFTFGAVLPTAVAALLAGISALVHLGLRSLLPRVWKRARREALS